MNKARIILIAAALTAAGTNVCHGQGTPLKYGGVLVRYGAPLAAKPTEGLRIFTDFQRFEVVIESEKAGTNADYLSQEASRLITLSKPSNPEHYVNKLFSLVFRDAKPPTLLYDQPKDCNIEGFVLRRDNKGHLSLGVVSPADVELFILPVVVSVPSTAFGDLLQKSETTISMLDMQKLTPEILKAHPWPWASSTDGIICQDSNGVFSLKGRIEFLIDPSEGGLNKGDTRLEVTDLRWNGGPSLNYGEGAKLSIRDTRDPVTLIDSDGTRKSIRRGTYYRKGAKWQELQP